MEGQSETLETFLMMCDIIVAVLVSPYPFFNFNSTRKCAHVKLQMLATIAGESYLSDSRGGA